MLLYIARRCNVTIRNWNPIEQIDRRAISKEIQINDFPPPTLREEQKKNKSPDISVFAKSSVDYSTCFRLVKGTNYHVIVA